MYSRSECGGEGWVLTGGVAPLSWCFSDGSVSAFSSSVISSSSMRDKSTVGCEIFTSSPSETSCISSSFLVCPAISDVLAGFMGEFSADST